MIRIRWRRRENNFERKNLAVVLGMYETGLGVGRSLGRNGIQVLGLDNKKDIGFYSKYIKAQTCPHPLEEEERFINFLLDFGKKQQEKPVLFITADNFLISISKNREQIQKYYLINLPNENIIESTSDKFKQFQLARNAGILAPKTYLPKNLDEVNCMANEIYYPVFIKAQDVNSWRKQISSSIKGFVINNEHDLINKFEIIFDRGVKAIVQEIIQGPDTNHFKVCSYISREGEILLRFTLQKIRQNPIRFGIGASVKSVYYPELLDLGIKFFKNIKYSGVGSAEFKLNNKDGNLYLIELNTRYWQQNSLAENCGMNFPLTDYLDVTGQKPRPLYDFRTGIKWINIYLDYESFLDYKMEDKLTFADWIKSLKGPKVFSDFSFDDIIPAHYEIRFKRNIFNLPKSIIRSMRNGK